MDVVGWPAVELGCSAKEVSMWKKYRFIKNNCLLFNCLFVKVLLNKGTQQSVIISWIFDLACSERCQSRSYPLVFDDIINNIIQF